MVGLGVLKILLGVVVAYDDILEVAVAVRDEERSQACSIGDELGCDVLCADGVELERVPCGLGSSNLGQCWQAVQDGRQVASNVHSDA